ncbi:MAG: BtpA family membrane complex biogenesis protein [Leptolyngbya sp. PLA1]|nr:BtpA family membrane complex biogenesis protein [Leptolyngbya sp. PLA1]
MRKPLVIGMVHAPALPGSPRARLPVAEIVKVAVREAEVLAGEGFGGIIVENMHDTPYVNGPHAPETVAAMTRVVAAVREAAPRVLLGVQVLSMGHLEALAIAHACGGDFIRVENFAFAHVADEGLLAEAAAGPLLRARRRLGAERIKLFCDIKKKHASHALTADLSIADTARGCEFFGADGVIVTGTHTGVPADPADVREAARATGLETWVGSGVTPESIASLSGVATGLIVGSYLKRGGRWDRPVDPQRCRQIVRAAE